MHEIVRTIRKILAEQLPTMRDMATDELRAMTNEELSQVGMVFLGGDLYSCAQQFRRDPVTMEWVCDWGHPGIPVSGGSTRYSALSSSSKQVALRASVFRDTQGSNLKDTVQANIAAQQGAIAESVGLIGEDTLVDLSSDDAEITEATRLAEKPDSSVAKVNIPMSEVVGSDVVEQEALIPHVWAGEFVPALEANV